MDGLTSLILKGNPKALALAKTIVTTPALINANPLQGLPYVLPLDPETYRQSGNAQVSENLLIVKSGKKYIADNVAPGPWTWDISGYIRGNPLVEQTNIYTPFVKLHTDILKNWYESGAVLVYKDIESRIYEQVVIQSLTIEHQKDCESAAPFSITLKQINVIGGNTIEGKLRSAVTEGSKFGTALKVGTSVASAIAAVGNLTSWATAMLT